EPEASRFEARANLVARAAHADAADHESVAGPGQIPRGTNRPACNPLADLPRIDVDVAGKLDALAFEGSETLARLASSTPKPDAAAGADAVANETREIAALARVERVPRIARRRSRHSGGRIVPAHQPLGHLREPHARMHPAQQQLVVRGLVRFDVASMPVDQLAPKRDARMRDRRLDETIERNLVGFAERVQPIDVQRIAARIVAVSAELDEAADDADVRSPVEQRDLRLETPREHLVVRVHARDQVAARRLDAGAQRPHD